MFIHFTLVIQCIDSPNMAEKVMISKIPNSLQCMHLNYFALINKQNNFNIELFTNMLHLHVPSVSTHK